MTLHPMLRTAGLATAAILFVCLPPVAAEDSSNWADLSKIRPGEKIQVVRDQMKTVNGRFESFSDDSIVVRQKSADVVVPKRDVVRVTITGRSKRLRNLAIGAAAGAGTGFLIGHIVTREKHDDWQSIVYFSTMVGLAGGTGVGATVASHPTVYRTLVPFPPAK